MRTSWGSVRTVPRAYEMSTVVHWVRGFGHGFFPTALVLRGQMLFALASSFALPTFGDALPCLVDGPSSISSFSFAGVFDERTVELTAALLLLVLMRFVSVVSLPLAATFSLDDLSTRLLLVPRFEPEATAVFPLFPPLIFWSLTPSALVWCCQFETSLCVGLEQAAAAPLFPCSLSPSLSATFLSLEFLVRSESLVPPLLEYIDRRNTE